MRAGNLEPSEEDIHLTVMEWVRCHPTIKDFVIHIPNQGKRSLRYGKLLKDMGMRSGVSDLFIAMAKHGYHGAWIELKQKKGRLSSEQKQFQIDMSEQSYYVTTCYSIERAINTIKWYCFELD